MIIKTLTISASQGAKSISELLTSDEVFSKIILFNFPSNLRLGNADVSSSNGISGVFGKQEFEFDPSEDLIHNLYLLVTSGSEIITIMVLN